MKRGRKIRVIEGLTSDALTVALETQGVNVRKFTVNADKSAVSKTGGKPLKKAYNYYIKNSADPVGSVVVGSGKAPRRGSKSIAPYLLDASKSVGERLKLLNAQPGDRLDDTRVMKVLSSIRDGAEQITGSRATANQLLANTNFDGTGLSAEQLVREGRSGRVLARLDDLRYGARD